MAGSSTALLCPPHSPPASSLTSLRRSTTIASIRRATPSPIPGFYNPNAAEPASVLTIDQLIHSHFSLRRSALPRRARHAGRHRRRPPDRKAHHRQHHLSLHAGRASIPDQQRHCARLRHLRLHHHRTHAVGLQLPVPVRRFLPAESAHRLLGDAAQEVHAQRQLRTQRSQKRHAGHQFFPIRCAGPRLRLRPRQLRHPQSISV